VDEMRNNEAQETKTITILDRTLLLITGLLAAYQVGFGIDSLGLVPEISYTIGFGVLLVAGLLIIILGFAVLDSPIVVVVSTIIPLSLSLGLVAQYFTSWQWGYLIFAGIGFSVVLGTRFWSGKALKIISLIIVHGISGLVIFFLPIQASISGKTPGLFSLVGVGGALIGIGGLLLSFLKMGKPILSKKLILTVLPGLLLLMMASFLVGFSALAA
jgi:hypothetical protein